MAVINPKPNTVTAHADAQGAGCGAAGAACGCSPEEANQRSHLASWRGGAIKKAERKKKKNEMGMLVFAVRKVK